ncbi:hypothetical protein HB662_06580 [Roseomonas frigidaquae]|uniref:DUF1127 domain-containing protein n=1 Tax=Falsiroseomonas frigidaquae TaxID=487318 RepID=A0ABX1EUW2_9PROT|nr:DUF1127 domain-containing protein [Falsiroseomonas frigidaquae]NKE44436.1 hypothetical protein [Falsiroseomonas frigidaquae]
MSTSLAAAKAANASARPAPATILRRLALWFSDLYQPWRDDLRSYDAHLLRDIGLTREEAQRLVGDRR